MKMNFPYTGAEVTAMINLLQPRLRWLSSTAIFGVTKGVSTTNVGVGINKNGIISVLEKRARGSKGQSLAKDSQSLVYIEIPHFPTESVLQPSDIQDMMRVDQSGSTPLTFDDELMKRLAKFRQAHDLTRERLRWGAIKGQLEDKNGSILDLYEALGATKKTIDFALGDAGTDVKEKCAEVADHVARELKGEVFDRIEVPVGKDFFNKLRDHDSVKEAYGQWQHSTKLTDPTTTPFPFGELDFRVVREYYPDKNGDLQPVVDPDKGHPILHGTTDLYVDHNGPADRMSMVNEPGQDIVLSVESLKHDKGVEIEGESNPLPICTQPGAIPELVANA